MTYLAISIGAVLGANARYLIGGWVADRMGSTFPYGTLIINASGSFLIGLILAAVSERALTPWWVRPTFAIGFLGSYTTFSTFSYETLSLVQSGSWALATVNVFGSVMGALAGVYLGTVLGRLI
jgi:CrcB protein